MNNRIVVACLVVGQLMLAQPIVAAVNPAQAAVVNAITGVVEKSNETLPFDVKNDLALVNTSQGSLAFEEKALALTEKLLTQYCAAFSIEQQTQLALAKNGIISTLKKFKINGMAFTADPNFAFIYNNQNPTFTMTYAGPDGTQRTRRFESSIDSWGFKMEATIRLDCIFFTDDALDYFESGKQLNLGVGVEVDIPAIPGAFALLYAPFTNAPGGVCILSMQCGLQANAVSIVTGGYIKPIPNA
jgi:hypothetical protein